MQKPFHRKSFIDSNFKRQKLEKLKFKNLGFSISLRTQCEILDLKYIKGPLWRNQISQKEEAPPSERWNKATRDPRAQWTPTGVQGCIYSHILNGNHFRITCSSKQHKAVLIVKCESQCQTCKWEILKQTSISKTTMLWKQISFMVFLPLGS